MKFKNSIVIFIISCFAFNEIHAQRFVKEYLNNVSFSTTWNLTLTVDSGYIYGYNINANSPGLNKGFVFKVDAVGDTVWTIIINAGDSSEYEFNDIASINDSNYILSGYWHSNTPTDSLSGISLTKLDFNGNIVWNKVITDSTYQGLQYFSFIKPSIDNGFVIANGRYVIKTDSLGDVLWSYYYPISSMAYFFNLLETPDSGIVLTSPNQYGDSSILTKLDSNGALIWRKVISKAGGLNGLLNGSDSSVYLSTLECIFKFDKNGNSLWSLWLDPVSSSYGIIEANNGSIIALVLNSSVGISIVEIDSAGSLLWGKKMSHTGNSPYGFSRTLDNGYILMNDFSLIKTDSLFEIDCDSTYNYQPFTLFNYSGVISNDTTLNRNSVNLFTAIPQSWTIEHGCTVNDLCFPVSITKLPSESYLIAYPNPSEGMIYFNSNLLSIEIYNILGEICYKEKNIKTNSPIDLSHLNKGLYFCKSITEDNLSKTSRIILQ